MSEPRGDYEPIVTVQSITPTAVNLHYSTQVTTRTGSIRQISVQRSVLLEDLASATFVNHWFSTSASRIVRGSTAIGVSTAVLRALKTKGVAEVALVDGVNSGLPADPAVQPNIYDYLTVYPLQRTGVVTVPVTVNDVIVELPASIPPGPSPTSGRSRSGSTSSRCSSGRCSRTRRRGIRGILLTKDGGLPARGQPAARRREVPVQGA